MIMHILGEPPYTFFSHSGLFETISVGWRPYAPKNNILIFLTPLEIFELKGFFYDGAKEFFRSRFVRLRLAISLSGGWLGTEREKTDRGRWR